MNVNQLECETNCFARKAGVIVLDNFYKVWITSKEKEKKKKLSSACYAILKSNYYGIWKFWKRQVLEAKVWKKRLPRFEWRGQKLYQKKSVNLKNTFDN